MNPPAAGTAAHVAPQQAPDLDSAAAPLARKLGLFDMTMLVMGSVIGVGIFVMPHVVAKLVHGPWLALGAWLLGGVISMAGSLVYAELVRRRPQVGGVYAFLREAYHPAVAFAYGWSLLWIIQSGGIASVAVVFADYVTPFLHLTTNPPQLAIAEKVVAAIVIAILTAINCTGVRAGSTTQNVFMILKVLVFAMLVICGLLLTGIPYRHELSSSLASDWISEGWSTLPVFGAALVQVFFAYGGWHTTTFVAGEVREPRRTLPRGLILGVLSVMAIYLALNVVCLGVLGVDHLAATDSPASAVMRLALGPTGAALIAAGIAISALGFLSQAILTSPRVYYAMARDKLFFRFLAWVHPGTRVPVMAVLLQGVVGMVIALSGTFEQIVLYVMPVEMTFFVLTAFGLFILRRRDNAAGVHQDAAMPGHPLTTLVFIGINLILVANAMRSMTSVVALGLAATAVPVYLVRNWIGRR